MEHRDRATGWRHAKLSGHENEALVDELFASDSRYQHYFLDRLGQGNTRVISIDTGGLNEKNVPCIFPNETTKSKADMYIRLEDGSSLNISIKKSLIGQVYLIGIDRFIDGFELQYKKRIPPDVKRAITLFWGSAEDVPDILKSYSYDTNYENRKHRLVAYTLAQYNSVLHASLLDWFKNNMYEITDFCFSKGLAKSPEDWANVIWYKNELGENSVDDVFFIDELCRKTSSNAFSSTEYGNRNGGSTIQLPFGFVQWHSPTKRIPGNLQFHHGYDKINSIM